MKIASFFADGVGRQDGPFLTTLPGRLSGWGGGRIPHRRRDFGASPRRESSDGVSVRAFGWGFGERRCPGFGRRGEKIRRRPFFDPINRYFCRERAAQGTESFASLPDVALLACGGGEFRGARAFCAGMRRGGGVPRRASDLVRAAARPGAGPFRQNGESTENGKSTENREKLRIGPKQRIDGI